MALPDPPHDVPAHSRTGGPRGPRIPGDYQHRALLSGHPVQRAWHATRLRVFDWFWRPEPGSLVVDLGCGSGIASGRLSELGARVLGLDHNAEAVAYAAATFGSRGAVFARADLAALCLRPRAFDAAVCCEVIEHLEHDAAAGLLRGARAALRDGGTLVLTTPNARGLWPLVEWLADKSGKTAKMAEEQHVLDVTRSSLRRLLADAGFEVVRLRTFCTFAPFAAPLHERAYDALERAERRVDLPFGNLLVCEARATQ